MATAKKGSKGKGKGRQDGERKPSPKDSAAEKQPMTAAGTNVREDPVDIGIAGFSDNIRLKSADGVFAKSGAAGLILLGLGAVIGMQQGDGFKTFLHSYLAAYMVAWPSASGRSGGSRCRTW
jgi:hypothetical protein